MYNWTVRSGEGSEKIFEEKLAGLYPNVTKIINSQIQDVHWAPSRRNHTWSYNNQIAENKQWRVVLKASRWEGRSILDIQRNKNQTWEQTPFRTGEQASLGGRKRTLEKFASTQERHEEHSNANYLGKYKRFLKIYF